MPSTIFTENHIEMWGVEIKNVLKRNFAHENIVKHTARVHSPFARTKRKEKYVYIIRLKS